MRTALFALFLSVGLTSATPNISTSKAKQTTVYICESKSAYAYHSSSNCKYLQKCTHNVITLSKADAETGGYKACKACY